MAAPARACILCAGDLAPHNFSEICAECRLIIGNLMRLVVEERWRDLGDGEYVVSERGRIARLLKTDYSHKYPRVSIGDEKRYVHQLVAEAWRGPRPDGAQALHWDDDPLNPDASNIRWGTPKENAEDAKRNRASAANGAGRRNNHERTHITHRRAQLLGLRAGMARRGRLDDGGQTSVRAGGHRPRARNTFYVGLTCPECHAAEAMADR